MDGTTRIGFRCKRVAPDADPHTLRAMNQVSVTVASLSRRGRADQLARLLETVGHNLDALTRQRRSWADLGVEAKGKNFAAGDLVPGLTPT